MPKLTFILPDGEERIVEAAIGDSLLEVCRTYDIPMEGACEGSLACSTCHVCFESQEILDSLPSMEEEEEDMLDLAKDVGPLSRLGCQIVVTAAMDGWRIHVKVVV